MYCTNKDKHNCGDEAAYLRSKLEDMLYQAQADFVFYGRKKRGANKHTMKQQSTSA